LKVYANDTSGNVGVSESFDFTIVGDGAFPILFLIPILLIVSVAFAALVYLKKRRERGQESLTKRGQEILTRALKSSSSLDYSYRGIN
jgi:hypothetical protein